MLYQHALHTESGQSQSCPDGMVFRSCGTACPTTCDNLNEDISCTRQCVQGCFCASGTVLNGDKCVQKSDCSTAGGSESPTVSCKSYKSIISLGFVSLNINFVNHL